MRDLEPRRGCAPAEHPRFPRLIERKPPVLPFRSFRPHLTAGQDRFISVPAQFGKKPGLCCQAAYYQAISFPA